MDVTIEKCVTGCRMLA